jgi:hypothetical protein
LCFFLQVPFWTAGHSDARNEHTLSYNSLSLDRCCLRHDPRRTSGHFPAVN